MGPHASLVTLSTQAGHFTDELYADIFKLHKYSWLIAYQITAREG